MKKLDLHLHTISTVSDSTFVFSIEKLKEYVTALNIDGIAITNHNAFDASQYKEIQEALEGICVVLPGIEINVGNRKGFGHLICISEQDDIDDFDMRCQKITGKIPTSDGKVTVDELKDVFTNLDKYLWIPHYKKEPVLDDEIIQELKSVIQCGEVGSAKKFIYCQKNKEELVPVYFSDIRLSDELNDFPARQTFFDIDEISISALKKCLINRNHVSLTEGEGNDMFYALPDLPLSTGLNVIIGERSSGKTYTLDQIAKENESVKYIKQFELIETDPKKSAKEFTDHIAAKKSSYAEEYFGLFKDAIDIVKSISLNDDESSIENYLSSLVKFAKESDRADSFAKCAIFKESKFTKRNFESLEKLIEAVERLLDAIEYKDIIEHNVERSSLISLHTELILKYNSKKKRSLEETWINETVQKIKEALRLKTASTEVEEVDLYECQLNRVKISKFINLVNEIKKESTINSQGIGNFTICTKKRAFTAPQELKKASGKKSVQFSQIFESYKNNPYEYLQGLKKMPEIQETDYYKYFAYVDYQILNQYGFAVSGGERAEFSLLQKINDAQKYDILLIDEPESSFDNIFLRDSVNHIIKELALTMPVILVTHNNTVGVSIKPDYLVFTKRIIENNIRYARYSGLPSSRELVSHDGETIKNIQALLDCLEAGEDTYNERKHDYEILKN